MAWATRPSRTWALAHAVADGVGAGRRLRHHALGDRARRDHRVELVGAELGEAASSGRPRRERMPSTSVRKTSFSASSVSAIAPATVSALMLYAWPLRSEPIVAMTGTRPSASSRWRIDGSTATDVADVAELGVARASR